MCMYLTFGILSAYKVGKLSITKTFFLFEIIDFKKQQ